MKILFSPSESKLKGGIELQINKQSFLFPELFEKRVEAIKEYQNFIDSARDEELAKLFGTKKKSMIDYYKGDLLKKNIIKTIERYDGVAFDYLKYKKLESLAQLYIDKNVIIFSNLFGPLLAGDVGVPDYKLKQGEKIGDFALEGFYSRYFGEALENYLKDEEIIDLRAGYYEKFYKISKPYITMKFLKDGKIISHWAKAYRGIVLREIAKSGILSIAELMDLQIENLFIKEIKEQKLKTEIVYNIL